MSANQRITQITAGLPVLHTGGLAAITAKILATAATVPTSDKPVVSLATIVAASVPVAEWSSPTTEIMRLRALSEHLYQELAETLTVDQRSLLDAYAGASSEPVAKESEWRVLEIERHLPRHAPTIRLLHQHVQHVSYLQPTPCCTGPSAFEGRD